MVEVDGTPCPPNKGEFYSEFGNFDVRITVPKNYVVAATGELQDEVEKGWLKTRGSPILNNEPQRASNQKQKATGYRTENYPPSDAQTKTLQYLQNNVHDFAWFADKRFIVNNDTCKLSSGKSIEIYTFYTKQQEEQYWKNSVQFLQKMQSIFIQIMLENNLATRLVLFRVRPALAAEWNIPPLR